MSNPLIAYWMKWWKIFTRMLCFSTDRAETESLLTNSSAPTDCVSWQDGNRKSPVCVSIIKTDQTNCNLHTVMSSSYKERIDLLNFSELSVLMSGSINIPCLDENQWSIRLTSENWGPLLLISGGEGPRYSRQNHPMQRLTGLLSSVSCLDMVLCIPAFFFLS